MKTLSITISTQEIMLCLEVTHEPGDEVGGGRRQCRMKEQKDGWIVGGQGWTRQFQENKGELKDSRNKSQRNTEVRR